MSFNAEELINHWLQSIWCTFKWSVGSISETVFILLYCYVHIFMPDTWVSLLFYTQLSWIRKPLEDSGLGGSGNVLKNNRQAIVVLVHPLSSSSHHLLPNFLQDLHLMRIVVFELHFDHKHSRYEKRLKNFKINYFTMNLFGCLRWTDLDSWMLSYLFGSFFFGDCGLIRMIPLWYHFHGPQFLGREHYLGNC